jgi:putative oxidoreductase
MLSYLLHTNADWVQLLVRLTLGIVFFAHGAQKLLGWFKGPGLKSTIKSLNQYFGIPASLTFVAVASEFFGGLGLIFGLLSRIAGVGIAVVMIVSVIMVHGRHGFFLNWFGDQQGHGYEYHLLAIALATVVISRGSGALSLDYFLFTAIHN